MKKSLIEVLYFGDTPRFHAAGRPARNKTPYTKKSKPNGNI